MELNVISAKDLLKGFDPGPRKRVGCCFYSKKYNSIIIEIPGHPGVEYDVDLKRCKTAGQCLDWIHQIGVTKNWGRAAIVDFIEILFDYVDVNLWSGK